MVKFFEKLKNRQAIAYIIAGIMFLALFIQMSDLTVRQGEELAAKAEESNKKTIKLNGDRGRILDRNGMPLAYDTRSYNVTMYRDPAKTGEKYRALYTDILIKVMDIVEKNGGKFVDDFAIMRSSDGEFRFHWDVTDPKTVARRELQWRNSMSCKYSSDLQKDLEARAATPTPSPTPSGAKPTPTPTPTPTPEETPPGESPSPTPSPTLAPVPDITITTDNLWDTAEGIYVGLRARYQIPDDMPYEKAIKILSAWQDIQLSSYRAYDPVTIATGVSMNTVADIETRSMELEGVGITESSTRVYPKGTLAAHVVGYTGRVDEDKEKELKAKGYSSNDEIGLSGVEATMEEQLSGAIGTRQGKKEVEINNRGTVTKTLSVQDPKAGNDVVLTIDSELQRKLEEALAKNIASVKTEQDKAMAANPQKYAQFENIDTAKGGAAIVMDVNTGDILGLASHPSFDPNLFVGGISPENWEKYSKDPANPMFNYAVSSKAAPGSTFKMVTALAGLMEGTITENTPISDKGFFDDVLSTEAKENVEKTGQHGPMCYKYTKYKKSYLHSKAVPQSVLQYHQNLTVKTALAQSCDYFFYTVAFQMGITKLYNWADKLGLNGKTGIELTSEAASQVANPKALYDNQKPINKQGTWMGAIVLNSVKKKLKEISDAERLKAGDEAISRAANKIVALVTGELDQQPRGNDIREILFNELRLDKNVTYYKGYDGQIDSFLNELIWTTTQTATAGVGQSVTAVTPISIVRYIAALVNGGHVLEPHIVKKVVDPEGRTVSETQPKVVRDLGVPQEYLNMMKEGMKAVVSDEDGTAKGAFENWGKKYKDQVGGKTGTAQVTKNLDIENSSWFVMFAPFDKPEIAVVVYIPDGYQGLLSSQTAKDIVQYYIDKKDQKASDDVQKPGDITN